MSNVLRNKFYNLFWKHKSCQNLFLLSRHELLDTKTIEIEGNRTEVSLPRIILSNIDNKDDLKETIQFRVDNENITAETFVESQIDKYQPILTKFLENKLGKALSKITAELNENPGEFIIDAAIKLFFSKKSLEESALELLKKYGLIGSHLKSFDEIESYFKKEFISKNFKETLSEENFYNFLEFVRSIKEIYLNLSYKSVFDSNQILVGSLHETDNYESRLKLFTLLYESKVITPSDEECFIECFHCEPGTYKGALTLKMSPKKTENLKCPICENSLIYFIPYRLERGIFEIIKSKDGLILDAVRDLLTKNGIQHELNVKYSGNVEIDCILEINSKGTIIETKMYQVIRSTDRKLISKVKGHYFDLIKKQEILNDNMGKQNFDQPILLINIMNQNLLNRIRRAIYRADKERSGRVMNLPEFKDYLNISN